MPSPPCERSSDRSTCVNISKMLSSLSGGMPMPVSSTVTTASSPSRSAVTLILPPGVVYLQLLLSRLPNTWARRTGSACR